MRSGATRDDIADVCRLRLRGSPAATNTGLQAPFTRLIDAEIVAAAPMLRGREGEDVCNPPPLPWWDELLSILLGWAFR
jgi:hypothetical protein